MLKALNTKTLIAILSAVLVIGGLAKTVADRSKEQTKLMQKLVASSMEQNEHMKLLEQIALQKPQQPDAKRIPDVTPIKPILLP